MKYLSMMSKKGQEKNYGNATEIIEVHSIANHLFNDRFKRIKTKAQLQYESFIMESQMTRFVLFQFCLSMRTVLIHRNGFVIGLFFFWNEFSSRDDQSRICLRLISIRFGVLIDKQNWKRTNRVIWLSMIKDSHCIDIFGKIISSVRLLKYRLCTTELIMKTGPIMKTKKYVWMEKLWLFQFHAGYELKNYEINSFEISLDNDDVESLFSFEESVV